MRHMYMYLTMMGILVIMAMMAVVAAASEKEAFTQGIRKTYRPWVRHWRMGFTNMYTNWHKYFMAKLYRHM